MRCHVRPSRASLCLLNNPSRCPIEGRKRQARRWQPDHSVVNPIGHAERLLPKARGLFVSPASFGLDLAMAITAGLFLAAYIVLEWVSFIHEYKGLPITPWNPGLGVVFALMIAGGKRYALVLFGGVVLAEILVLNSNLEWRGILGIAAIIALGYGAVASGFRRHFRIDTRLHRLPDLRCPPPVGLS